MHTQIIMNHHCEEKASKLEKKKADQQLSVIASKVEKEKADQQLSGIAQLSSSNIYTVVEEQYSLMNYWIAKIEEDFDVIDYFFSNPYKYSATPILKAQFYKDAEAYKEDSNSNQCYSNEDSSEDNLQGNSSVSSEVLCLPDEESLITFDSDYLENSHDKVIDSSVTYDDLSDDFESDFDLYDFDPYHDDIIMYHASQFPGVDPKWLIFNVTNETCECDSSKVLCSPDKKSLVPFDFGYLENMPTIVTDSSKGLYSPDEKSLVSFHLDDLENLHTNVNKNPIPYGEMDDFFDPYLDDMIFTLHQDLRQQGRLCM